METLLVINGLLTPYAVRGVQQSLEPITSAASVRRSVNGTLVDLSVPELRKYRSTISCADQSVPAVDGVWPGLVVTVDCIVELAYPGDSTGPAAGRDIVEGSERVDGDFVFYRPRLSMMVLSHSVQHDEYGAVVSWSLELEEV
jgi:hypothetical protein